MELEQSYLKLQQILKDLGSVLVAFSGGVDSTLLLKVAHDTLGDRTAAATGISATYASEELNEARALARQIGARHFLVRSEQLSNPDFVRNDPRRCYYCKTDLFEKLRQIAAENQFAHIAEGTVLDDLGDYRPGLAAAQKYGIESPLVQAGFDKEAVRLLSRRFKLPTWNKPAEACLSSRFPYGTPITLDLLHQVHQAEKVLKSRGFTQVRVRVHGPVARIELPPEELSRILQLPARQEIATAIKALGFQHVALDLEGYRKGSLNAEL